MKGLALTQYISIYQDIVFKLKEIDTFQIVDGFLRGSNPEYDKEVRSKYTNTLEEFIKYAQIYVDSRHTCKGGKHQESHEGRHS